MVKQITRDELIRMLFSATEFKLVDVLPRDHYEKEHIKGAISLPLDEIEEKAGKMLKKDSRNGSFWNRLIR